MPEKVPQDVTDAELAVLQALWESGSATIRQLTAVLYPTATTPSMQPCRSCLNAWKPRATSTRSQWARALFRACTDRDTLVGHRLRAMAEKLCGGLMAPLLTHLVRAEALSLQERRELRELIDKLDRKNKSK